MEEKTMKVKIVIEVENREIELTEEEAKILFDKLKGLFGSQTTYIPYPIYPTYQYPIPINPYYSPYFVSSTNNLCLGE